MQERKKRQKKKFQNLTIRDDFMFAAVLADEEICRKVLSLALGTPVSHVEVVPERTVRYHPEFRGIRLDICAHCRNGTCFDVEMQRRRDDVPHRSRYYHSQMDMSLLKNGADYRKLPTGYVIFICCFDPVGDNRYRYLFTARCQENGKAADDGHGNVLFLLVHVWLLPVETNFKNEEWIKASAGGFHRWPGGILRCQPCGCWAEWTWRPSRLS